MEKLLIVDDSEEIRTQLKWGLKKDYSVFFAGDADEALSVFQKHQPQVVTLDLGLPPDEDGVEEGFRCLGEILKRQPNTKVIVLTGRGERENALKAIKMGAYDFYPKPIDLSELKVILKRAFNLFQLEEENRRLQSAVMGNASEMTGLLGECPEMMDVFGTIRKVASCDVPVLILGESGTGKELVAQALHAMSLRKEKPFVPINCGAIPENLLESELFGHEKGAFTGAHARIQGKVEYADGGTLFLDEIGELPVALQVKLLRFIQEKVIQRVGGRENIDVDTRIIAATNIDIEKSIEGGFFREDLYYRIGVITIKLPPLRDRGDDILLLANLFLQRYSEEFKKNVRGFSVASAEFLESYEWPGNVRELENKLKRAVIMTESPVIEPQDLGFADKGKSAGKETSFYIEGMTLKEAKDKLERDMVLAAIEQRKGNIAKASEVLAISRPTLYDLMRKHDLQNK